jgi:lipopolysaccharide export system permease protein
LRLAGFASTVFALKYSIAVAFQYVAVAATIAAGLFVISRGLIVEPPAFLTNATQAIGNWLARHGTRFARVAP